LCRYWALGSLGPVDSPETAAKRAAAARARQYGKAAKTLTMTKPAPRSGTSRIAGSLTCSSRGGSTKQKHAAQPLSDGARSIEDSKTRRAREFAKTIRAPAPPSARKTAARSTTGGTAAVPSHGTVRKGGAGATATPPPQPWSLRPGAAAVSTLRAQPASAPEPRRVTQLLEAHDAAARHVAAIAAEAAAWPLPTPTPPAGIGSAGNSKVTRRCASARRKAPVKRMAAPPAAPAARRVSADAEPALPSAAAGIQLMGGDDATLAPGAEAVAAG
jgi:hypothetical protein